MPFVVHLPKWMVYPFFVSSYMGFSNFCNSGQNMLTKFTMPVKLPQPFWLIGGFNFWIASSLLCHGFTHTILSLMKIVFPIYCSSVLNNWHFFGEIFKPFLHNALNKFISFSKCICLLYDCHTVGEMLSPIGILWYKNDALPKYGSIPQYFLELSVSLSEWKCIFSI